MKKFKIRRQGDGSPVSKIQSKKETTEPSLCLIRIDTTNKCCEKIN